MGNHGFGRIDPKADYVKLNDISKYKISESSIRKHREDILRVAISLKLGHVTALDLIRSLLRKNRPSGLAKALMNLERIIKTLYLLNDIDDKDYRRHILTQLNALGLATHAIVLWNTVYMQAALDYLRSQGEVIKKKMRRDYHHWEENILIS